MPDSNRLLTQLAEQLTTELDTMFLRFFTARAPKDMEALDLKPRDVMMLAVLSARGPLPMSALAEAFGLPLSTTTHQIDRLVEQKLVTRERSEQDRRIVTIAITPAGHERNRRLHAGRIEMSRAMLAALSPGERQMLVELFAKINHSLPQDKEP